MRRRTVLSGGRNRMRGCLPWTATLLLVCIWSATSSVAEDSAGVDSGAVGYAEQIQPILKAYCYDCHGDGATEGQLALDDFATSSDAEARPDIWWNVLKNVRAQVMPPVGSPRPSVAEVEQLANWIKFRVFQIDPDNPDPGKLTVRRLNRTEYGNTVADLMGVDFDATLLFPPDDSGYGFDNVGDALSFSPLLMEKYLKAAQNIVSTAVPVTTWVLPSQEVSGRDFRSDEGDVTGQNLSSRKPAHVRRGVSISVDGDYAINVQVRLHGTFEFDPARYTMIFRIDGEELSRNEYGWDENKRLVYDFEQHWSAGDHQLSFELVPIPTEESADGAERDSSSRSWFEVARVRIEGPANSTRLVHPPHYSRFFPRDNPPERLTERQQYAREILTTFARRAFRQHVTEPTIQRLMEIVQQAWLQPEATFESGVAQGMIAVLASPRFLFRLEMPTDTDGASEFAPVDELSLASRLSYFLWSTLPDDELFQLAEQGQLRNQLEAQVQRMLRDDRARDFIRNFVGQWLRTRDVRQVTVDPLAVLGLQQEYDELLQAFRNRRSRRFDQELTPEEEHSRNRFREIRGLLDQFDDELKRSMQRETELCVEHIAKHDLSLLDLLDSRYTFLNEKLARHYGIANVSGSEMRLVELPAESPRGGVLTHASMLLITSNPTRTSPVKRGLFVLENVLGTPSPPAPPDVPSLEASAERFGDREPTLRELLAAHRESALCASCHARMDPLGLALENFDAFGRWRDAEADQAIDASGTLITGESFSNILELKQILREHHATDFYRCLAQKMLTFAVGRGLDYTDEHTVDVLVGRLHAGNGRFSELIHGVVESAPFQKMRTSQFGTDVIPDTTSESQP